MTFESVHVLRSIATTALAALFAVLPLLAGAVPPSGVAHAQGAPATERDWALPGGRFFTQAGAGQGGFAISDDDGMRFWSAYQQLGGSGMLGYPASRRFSLNGFVYQATQAALLQWRPDGGALALGNTFELLQEAGRDAWLDDSKGIPRPIANDGSTSYEDAVRIRLGWLTEPAIRERYLRNPNPAGGAWTENDAIQLYGLPMSRPEARGPFVAQRFQRVAFQLWTAAIPGMPSPGTVTAVLGGDLLKEAGVIDGVAATPHTAAALVNRPVALGAGSPTSPVATQAAPVAPAAPTTVAATPTPLPAGGNAPAATARPGALQVIDGTLSEYSIYVPQMTAKLGPVRFVMANVGVARHNLRVLGPGVDRKTADLRAGQSGQVQVTFDEPGPYTLYCDIADHEALGMTLQFVVER